VKAACSDAVTGHRRWKLFIFHNWE